MGSKLGVNAEELAEAMEAGPTNTSDFSTMK